VICLAVFEGKRCFIEYNMMCEIYFSWGNVKTLVAMMIFIVSKEDTSFGSIVKFMLIVWMSERPTFIAKNFEEFVVRGDFKEKLVGRFVFGDFGRKSIYKICG
jgi:hypothetical protein